MLALLLGLVAIVKSENFHINKLISSKSQIVSFGDEFTIKSYNNTQTCLGTPEFEFSADFDECVGVSFFQNSYSIQFEKDGDDIIAKGYSDVSCTNLVGQARITEDICYIDDDEVNGSFRAEINIEFYEELWFILLASIGGGLCLISTILGLVCCLKR